MALEYDDAWQALDEEDTDLNALVEAGLLDPNSQYVRDKRAELRRRYRELAAWCDLTKQATQQPRG